MPAFPCPAALLAVIGLGLLTGCVAISEPDRRVLREHRVPGPLYQKMLHREPLSLVEIAELSASSVPPAFIIRYVDESLAEYQLTTDEVLRLRRAGVSHEVIDFLLTTPQRSPRAGLDYDPFWNARVYQPVIIHRHYHRR